jgi:hypothetical protein
MKGNSMTFLDAWQQGHKEGLQLAVDQLNRHCGMNFKTISDAIVFINSIKDEDQRIDKSNRKLARDIALQNWLMAD